MTSTAQAKTKQVRTIRLCWPRDSVETRARFCPGSILSVRSCTRFKGADTLAVRKLTAWIWAKNLQAGKGWHVSSILGSSCDAVEEILWMCAEGYTVPA